MMCSFTNSLKRWSFVKLTVSSLIVVFQLRESQIVSLYRAGHDTIGEEILNSLDEEQRRLAGIKLLRVCLLRLAAL